MELFKLYGNILIKNEEAEKSIAKSVDSADKLANEFDKAALGSTKMGQSISSSFKNITSFVDKLGINIGSISKIAVGAGAAIASVGVMAGTAIKFAETTDVIDKMSQKIGISAEGYQRLKYAAGQSGIDIDIMQTSMKKLNGIIDDSHNGVKSATEHFEKLGISIYDSSGELKSSEDIMMDSLKALADMEAGAERSALAVDLFGKGATELAPLLNEGSVGIQELTDRAEELGIILSNETVSSGVVFGDTVDDMNQALGGIGNELLTRMLPIAQDMADWVLDNMPTIKSVVGGAFSFIGDVLYVTVDVIKFLYDSFSGAVNGIVKGSKYMYEKAEPYIAGLNRIFKGFLTLLDTVTFGLTDFSKAYDDIETDRWEKKYSIGKYSKSNDDIEEFANGGIISSGTHIVGEKGAELLQMINGKAVVTPMLAGSSGTGGDVFNITINANEIDDINNIVNYFKNLKQRERMG